MSVVMHICSDLKYLCKGNGLINIIRQMDKSTFEFMAVSAVCVVVISYISTVCT